MKISRRYFGLLFPLAAKSQTAVRPRTLSSGAFRFEDLPVRASGSMRLRQILKGLTHNGFLIDVHESDLAPDQMPHPPHHHVHEEMLLIKEGQVEITISGKTTVLDAGSVAYIASGEQHGWKNTGSSTARYFVVALGGDKA